MLLQNLNALTVSEVGNWITGQLHVNIIISFNIIISLVTFGLVLPAQVLGSQWRQRMRREE